MNNIDVVYTLWSNLKKTMAMEVGQVGFHDHKAVHTVKVDKKDNEIIKRLEKTKVWIRDSLKFIIIFFQNPGAFFAKSQIQGDF